MRVPSWKGNVGYVIGSLVLYSDVVYICTAPSQGTAPNSSGDWQTMVAQLDLTTLLPENAALLDSENTFAEDQTFSGDVDVIGTLGVTGQTTAGALKATGKVIFSDTAVAFADLAVGDMGVWFDATEEKVFFRGKGIGDTEVEASVQLT